MVISNRVVTGPAAEPLDLDQVRRQVRQIEGIDDTSLLDFIARVRGCVEDYLHRSLITQTREQVMDCFPRGMPIELQFGPVQSLSSVKYLDDSDVEQTESAANYETDIYSVPARVQPRFGRIWPVLLPGLNRVRVRYVAGYGASHADVPPGIKTGMMLIIGTLYEHREDIVVGATAVEIPQGARAYLLPHVVHGH